GGLKLSERIRLDLWNFFGTGGGFPCAERCSVSNDRQHVAPTLVHLTIGDSKNWNHYGRQEHILLSNRPSSLFRKFPSLTRNT
ncbi:unnamed protein product, partial [Larinioides sclopetarius]